MMHRCLLFALLSCCLSCGPGRGQATDNDPDTLLGWQCSRDGQGGWQVLDEQGMVITRGDEAHCQRVRYTALRKRYGDSLPNLPVATLGGKQYWADRMIRGGWRIQQHVKTGHHRLLDQGDIRRAWGSWEQCRLAMERRSLDGTIGDDDTARPTVILVHGIFRSKDSLGGLHRQLVEAGFQVIAVNYPSCHENIADCADDLAGVFDRLPAFDRCHVVTHSMGGLVMRELLGRADPGPWSRRFDIDSLCMLFPPNQGAEKADRLHEQWWYRLALGPAGQELTSTVAPHLPRPPVPTAIIAGGTGDERGRSRLITGDDDGTVAVRETRLPGCQGPLVLPVGHTFGMNDPQVAAAVIGFLQTGRLRSEPTLATHPPTAAPPPGE